MFNKKTIIICLTSLLILNILAITLTLAQEAPPGLPAGLEDPEKLIEQAKNKTLTGWDYLGKEWQNMLLKNPFVSKADAFFTKISIVFEILFGMPYSLSITLLVIIILWFYFFLKFGEIFSTFSVFSSGVSWIIAFASTIIMAQMQILRKITEFLGWLVFAKKGTWWNILMMGIIILVFILIYYLSSAYLKKIKEQREKMEKEKTKQAEKIIQATAEGIKEGLKE